MKYWKQICVISIAVMLAAAGCLFFAVQQEDVGRNTEEESSQGEAIKITQSEQVTLKDMQIELHERLYSFALVLYQYDTAERKFYEGAEEYMTQQAYGKLCPVSAQEKDEQGAVRVCSTLLEANIYVFYESMTEAEVILESHFSLTQGTNGSLTQYSKLALERQEEEWLITECQIIDTLEE